VRTAALSRPESGTRLKIDSFSRPAGRLNDHIYRLTFLARQRPIAAGQKGGEHG
jgi:hypothetical protein